MSDATPYKPSQWRKNRGSKVSLDGLPSAEELAQQPHKGDDADRFSLYTTQQVEGETGTVRFDLTFKDVIKVRDQAEMVIEAMRLVIAKTREHDLGSIRQRVEARREAQSLSRTLARFNGKSPRGDWKPKGR